MAPPGVGDAWMYQELFAAEVNISVDGGDGHFNAAAIEFAVDIVHAADKSEAFIIFFAIHVDVEVGVDVAVQRTQFKICFG